VNKAKKITTNKCKKKKNWLFTFNNQIKYMNSDGVPISYEGFIMFSLFKCGLEQTE